MKLPANMVLKTTVVHVRSIMGNVNCFDKSGFPMPPFLEELEKQAMELPLPDRAKLIAVLIAPLDSADEDNVEGAWAQEAQAAVSGIRIRTNRGRSRRGSNVQRAAQAA